MDNKLVKDIADILMILLILYNKIKGLSIKKKYKIYSRLSYFKHRLTKYFLIKFSLTILNTPPI